ncbi:hypothetical protein SLA2020_047890 [Shorea laevis]
MIAQISKPNLPRKVPRTQAKRKVATPADSSNEYTPSKQRRTGGVKMMAAKPSSAKKLIKSASSSESSTSAAGTQPQFDKAKDVLLEVATMADLVEEVSTASGRGDFGSFPTKSGNDSPPATKILRLSLNLSLTRGSLSWKKN